MLLNFFEVYVKIEPLNIYCGFINMHLRLISCTVDFAVINNILIDMFNKVRYLTKNLLGKIIVQKNYASIK